MKEIIAALVALSLVGTANAATITFEGKDIFKRLDNGYAGIEWHGPLEGFAAGPAGRGFDGQYAYQYGSDETETSFGSSDGSLLWFESGEFASVWSTSGLELTINALVDGVVVGSTVIGELDYRAPTEFAVDLVGDSFSFILSGDPMGASRATLAYIFGMDNLSLRAASERLDVPMAENPVPAAGILLLSGLAALGLRRRG